MVWVRLMGSPGVALLALPQREGHSPWRPCGPFRLPPSRRGLLIAHVAVISFQFPPGLHLAKVKHGSRDLPNFRGWASRGGHHTEGRVGGGCRRGDRVRRGLVDNVCDRGAISRRAFFPRCGRLARPGRVLDHRGDYGGAALIPPTALFATDMAVYRWALRWLVRRGHIRDTRNKSYGGSRGEFRVSLRQVRGSQFSIFLDIQHLLQPSLHNSKAYGFLEVAAGKMAGTSRSQLLEEFARASRLVDTAPETLPTCAVPSNLLLYAFLAYVCPTCAPGCCRVAPGDVATANNRLSFSFVDAHLSSRINHSQRDP